MNHSLPITSLILLSATWSSLATAQFSEDPLGYPPAPSAQPAQQAPGQQQAPEQQPSALPPPVTATQAQPPANSTPLGSYGNASSFAVDSAPSVALEAPEAAKPKRSGVVFVPKFGVSLSGRATFSNDIKCDTEFDRAFLQGNSFCNPLLDTTDQDGSHHDTSSLLVGADLLFHVTPQLRIGASALWNPNTEVEFTSSVGTAVPFKMGQEFALDATLEHVFADSKTGSLFYRFMIGPSLLLAGGDLANGVKDDKETCRTLLKVCEFDSGIFPGYNWGAGLGALFPMGGSALRTDLLLNYVSVPFRHVQATVEVPVSKTADATVDESATFTRLWFMVGAEI